jgi:VanZ family protein
MGLAQFARFWLPVLLWMSIIFAGSTDLASPKHTSRIIEPFLRWIAPGISEEMIQGVQYLIRKSAHATEYAVLSLLLWRARRRTQQPPATDWKWQDALFAVTISGLYAASDEYHQSFVSTRQAAVLDVLIDTSGAIAAMLLIWFVGRVRRS